MSEWTLQLSVNRVFDWVSPVNKAVLEYIKTRRFVIPGKDQIWVVRCLGPEDGSAEPDHDAIVGSITFE